MLQKIKLLLGLTDNTKDDLIQALIESAVNEATAFTNNSDIHSMEHAICSMVVYTYNRLGSEGVNSESYSGVNFTYSSDYPDNIMRMLKAHRKVRVIC